MMERQHPARKIKQHKANASSACQEPNQNCFTPLTSRGSFSFARSSSWEQGRKVGLGRIFSQCVLLGSASTRVQRGEGKSGAARERGTERCWASGRDGDGELGDYSVRGSASLKAHCSWNRGGVGAAPMLLVLVSWFESHPGVTGTI